MMKTVSNSDSLQTTEFLFPGQTSVYHGKVRDVYNLSDDLLVMVVTNRISCFDVILPVGIPHKGQVLNQLAAKFLAMTTDIVPNWVLASPDPNVSLGVMCEPYKVEMVIRGYLAGHAWREYKAGKRTLCGVTLPDGLKENDKLPQPILTPTTKASVGHDEDISREEILAQGLVSEAEYTALEDYTRRIFARGTEYAATRGLILVDTKYEFGKANGKIYLIDEIHTPDSSRYFYSEGYSERQAKGEAQKQLSKEFVREWLIENGFQGKEGQRIPQIPESFINQVTERYIELYEHIAGERFQPADLTDVPGRIEKNVNRFLSARKG